MAHWNRREFLSVLLGSSITAVAQTPNENTESWLFAEKDKKGFSILQGMTDETSTQFTIVLPKGTAWKIEVARKDGRRSPVSMTAEVLGRRFSEFEVHKVEVDGLQLGAPYLLRVLDERGRVQDERDFRALDLSPRHIRLAFVSCALDLLHRDDIWEQFDRKDPEMVLFLGDNVYADRTSFISKTPADEKQLWERYVLTRNRVAFYYQRKLRPVIATWDDHDYGADNSGRQFAHREASHVTFETFFAQKPRTALLEGPGIARRFSAFGADFFFMDGRSFRDPSGSRNARMFGEEQERWLLANSQPRATWLINGSMFFGAYTDLESFEGPYARNFAPFLRSLAGTKSLYCFASGDVHFSEVMDIEADKLGYPTFELVSSSIHSYTFPGHDNRFSNPRRRESASAHNFVIYEGVFSENGLDGEVASYSAGSEEFRTAVRVTR